MTRGIDHLVLAVRDLDAARSFYERLGFQVGARNRHPWGTENRLVQLRGSFLELVAVADDKAIPAHGPRQFSFGAFVKDYLAQREGLAMLVLDSADSKHDAAEFDRVGLGNYDPFFFERSGRRPDGSETRVAFTLAFAADQDAPGIGYFVCQHHHPENFWNEAFQKHPNGASEIATVVLASPEPQRHAAFLRAFTGAVPVQTGGADFFLPLSRGRIDVATPDDASESYPSVETDPHQASLVAFSVRVPDIGRQERALAVAAVPFQHVGTRLVVPSSAGFGVAIAFEPGGPVIQGARS
jgi:catechol 2,3-dioxygenase-like lactoylglutathione lyase family enzyme